MERIRDRFLSMEDIFEHRIGYQFYDKDGVFLYEIIDKSKSKICIARGFFHDKYQTVKTIEFINKWGNKFKVNNLVNSLVGTTLYDCELEKNNDWYDLNYLTVDFVENETKIKYKEYLKNCHSQGMLTTLELLHRIEELNIK